MNRLTTLVVLAFTYFILTNGAIADVEINRSQTDAISVYIVNEIKRQDVEKIAPLADNIDSVVLASDGGDVGAAMAIGRIVRDQKVPVIVPQQARCLSSCSLIYISGVSRLNAGIVGLHRPYLSGDPLNSGDVKRAVSQMLLDIKKYITEMGVTDEFYNIMVNTEPKNMRVYDFETIKELVPDTDPLWDEVLVALGARRIGITTMEYRKRDADGDHCSNRELSELTICREALLWGLSEPVYEMRDKAAQSRCQYPKSEMSQIPKKLRADHPLFIKYQDCVRSILLDR